MAVTMHMKLPKTADLASWFTNWFWLLVIVLWFSALILGGLKAKEVLQTEVVNPQLLTAKEERIDQNTLLVVKNLVQTRSNRTNTEPPSSTRFTTTSQ